VSDASCQGAVRRTSVPDLAWLHRKLAADIFHPAPHILQSVTVFGLILRAQAPAVVLDFDNQATK
jgi:hypothetical protein